MKKLFSCITAVLVCALVFWSCKKDNYPGSKVSPYMAIFDLRDLYRGEDVMLTPDVMFGSDKITGIVVSDHSGNNLPEGLLVLQDRRRLNQLRGISINIGSGAADFVPGDSVVVDVKGGVLKRVDGILQVTGLTKGSVTKVSSGNPIPVNRVPGNLILADPGKYESTFVVLVKAGFNPLPASGDKLAGEKVLNDGFADLVMLTKPTATFANDPAPFLANFYTIVFIKEGQNKELIPELRMRTGSDIIILSSTIEVTPIVITGFMNDAAGGDGNYEYVQFMATRDIDFSATPFSVIFTNNANSSTPTGFPVNGWATGGKRTYKINLTSGTAAKGTYFYVGGISKLINGSASTNISSSNWIRSYDYVANNGEGFGTKTTGLLANSGNASGIAVFEGTAVSGSSKPLDVVFIGTGGNLYSPAIPAGYRIANTDFYDVKNPITLVDQPFYRSGTNTLALSYKTADLGFFNMLGGVYDPALGRWTKARIQNNVLLSKTSPVSDIEGEGATKLK